MRELTISSYCQIFSIHYNRLDIRCALTFSTGFVFFDKLKVFIFVALCFSEYKNKVKSVEICV